MIETLIIMIMIDVEVNEERLQIIRTEQFIYVQWRRCVFCFYFLAILTERDLFIYILFTPNNFCIFINKTYKKKERKKKQNQKRTTENTTFLCTIYFYYVF